MCDGCLQTHADEISPASDARGLVVGREIQANVKTSLEKKSDAFDSCRLSSDHDRMHVGFCSDSLMAAVECKLMCLNQCVE
jgi:hypothetical protein